MEKLLYTIKCFFAVFGGVVSQLFGGFDIWIQTLLLFVTLDVITGIIKAVLLKSDKSSSGGLDSSVMWQSG